MHLLLPTRLNSVGKVAQVLMPGLYISCVSVYLKYCLNALGRNMLDAAASALGMAVFAAILLLPAWSAAAIGAAIAWNLGEVAIFLLRGIVIHKDARIPSTTLWILGGVYPILCGICFYLASL